MENIEIAKICGICAGCKYAIDTTIKQLHDGQNVALLKSIVHNKNVNNMLKNLGAVIIEKPIDAKKNQIVIIRAHGEPPETYEVLKNSKLKYIDCTCKNVQKIHECVYQKHKDGFCNIIIGKYGKHSGEIHPEVFGTLGYAGENAILIEDEDDLIKISNSKEKKFYLTCQTTFKMDLVDKFIKQITDICKAGGKQLEVSRTICGAQIAINKSSLELAASKDIMIVVGGKNSSNTVELYKKLSEASNCVFIEDINDWKSAFDEKNIVLSSDIKIGITAGASTMRSELVDLKNMIEKEIEKIKWGSHDIKRKQP